MKKIILVLFCLIALTSFSKRKEGLERGDMLPIVELFNLDEELVGTTMELRGKFTVINIGASWCPPCKEEKPMLDKLNNRIGDKVNIVSIMGASKSKDVRKFYKKNKLNFRKYYDLGDNIIREYYVTGFPTTYILNSQGVVLARILGVLDWNEVDYEWFEEINKGV